MRMRKSEIDRNFYVEMFSNIVTQKRMRKNIFIFHFEIDDILQFRYIQNNQSNRNPSDNNICKIEYLIVDILTSSNFPQIDTTDNYRKNLFLQIVY